MLEDVKLDCANKEILHEMNEPMNAINQIVNVVEVFNKQLTVNKK